MALNTADLALSTALWHLMLFFSHLIVTSVRVPVSSRFSMSHTRFLLQSSSFLMVFFIFW